MNRIIAYCKESYNELANKVSWPAWKDLQSSAVVVMIASMIIALTIAVMDWASNSLLSDVLYKLAG